MQKSPLPFGVCAIFTNIDGKILLGKRKNAYKSGLYGLPGGRINQHELLIEAIRREVTEETGLENIKFSFVGVVREKQEQNDFVHFIYQAKIEHQQPQLREQDKCEGWQWLDPEDVKENILPGHYGAIKMWKAEDKLMEIS